MNLFTIDNNVLVIEAESVRAIKEFNNLLRRSAPCDGDKDGSKKIMCFKEFLYIYHMCDYKGVCKTKGYNPSKAHTWARTNADLPTDWKPDNEVKAAMVMYESLRPSAPRELLYRLTSAFYNSSRIIEKMNEFVNKMLDKPNLDGADLQAIVSSQKELLGIATALPKQIESLAIQEKAIVVSEKDGEIARGGIEVLDSQNPETSL